MKEKKKKSPLSIIGLVFGIILLLAAVVFLIFWNRTALFADIDTVHGNYLPVAELNLRDGFDVDTAVNDPRNPFKYDLYENSYYYADNDSIRFEDGRPQTSKGVRTGDSFEDFLLVYDSYIADSISVYDPHYEGERDDAYYDSHYFYDLSANDILQVYTVEEFVDMDAFLTVTYKGYVKGRNAAYTDDELYDFYGESYDSFKPRSGILNPRIQTYSLEFTFRPVSGKLTLLTIDSTRYIH